MEFNGMIQVKPKTVKSHGTMQVTSVTNGNWWKFWGLTAGVGTKAVDMSKTAGPFAQ